MQLVEPPETSPGRRPRRSSPVAIVVGAIIVIATLRLGRALVLPVVIAILLTLTFRAPVRWLEGKRVPARFGAGLLILFALGIVGGAATLIASPAMEWFASAPRTIQSIELKVRGIMKPIHALEQSASRMQQAAAPPDPGAPTVVQVATPGLFTRLAGDSLTAIPAALSVVFLTYF